MTIGKILIYDYAVRRYWNLKIYFRRPKNKISQRGRRFRIDGRTDVQSRLKSQNQNLFGKTV